MPMEGFLVGSDMLPQFRTRTVLIDLVKSQVFLDSQRNHDDLWGKLLDPESQN